MNRLLRARLLTAGALLALSALAQSQSQSQVHYMWIDEKGLKQFSDRAPPASVPLTAILKAPRGAASAASAAAMPSATTMPSATVATDGAEAAIKPGPALAPTVAERNVDYRKRVRENLEREQKEQDALIANAGRADNCARARAARQSIDSGARIGIQDKNGERGFMSDEQRVAEAKKIDKILAACK